MSEHVSCQQKEINVDSVQIAMIYASDRRGLIGVGNTIPWKIRDDMRHFKFLTENHVVVMGRKTFESMGCKSLPNRINIVVSRTSTDVVSNDDQVIYVSSYAEAERVAREKSVLLNKDRFWVIGGVSAYEHFELRASDIYRTEVHTVIDVSQYEGSPTYFKLLTKRMESLSLYSSIFFDKSDSNEYDSVVRHYMKT